MSSDLSQYLGILRRRLWMIVLLFAVTMIVIGISAFTAKPSYQSAVRLQIIPLESQVALFGPRELTARDVDLIAFQFGQMVRSAKIAWRTINQLGLATDAETLLRRLSTAQDGDFMTVVVEADTPADAEQIVTTQVENALTAFRTDQMRPAAVTGAFIAEQLEEAEQTLAAARNDLLRFKLRQNLESLEREIIATQDSVRSLRSRKTDAALVEAQLAARIAVLEEEANLARLAAEQARPNSAAQDAANRREAELRSTVAALRGELAAQRALQSSLDLAVAEAQTELTSLIGLSEEAARLTQRVAEAQDARDFLFDKWQEAQLKQRQGLNIGYLKVVDPARRPDQPLPGRTLQLALIGGVLSLVLGAMLAFLFEFLESLVRRPGGARP